MRFILSWAWQNRGTLWPALELTPPHKAVFIHIFVDPLPRSTCFPGIDPEQGFLPALPFLRAGANSNSAFRVAYQAHQALDFDHWTCAKPGANCCHEFLNRHLRRRLYARRGRRWLRAGRRLNRSRRGGAIGQACAGRAAAWGWRAGRWRRQDTVPRRHMAGAGASRPKPAPAARHGGGHGHGAGGVAGCGHARRAPRSNAFASGRPRGPRYRHG